MSLAPGTRVGPYEILAPLGAGGMGEVYRARDTKLKREVALKVLPDFFAGDPERMARFQREAEVLAALNHPNIAQIYGVEDRALVMELVPGESLKGPLPLETALNYAKQIADALEAAHEKNIIHRDLKPANIMITPAGVVKVLDFGLAAVAQSSDPSNPVNSPTLTISPTRAGMILGTAAYMSPEQARGKPVDKRADIWAFGVVLYETLTGQRLFEGETVSDTLAHVLTKQPDWERVPAQVRRLLQACLQKDPKQRLQAIGDWKLMLADEQQLQITAPSRSRHGIAGWVAAGVVTVALAGLAFVHFREKPPAAELSRFQIPMPANLNFPGPTAAAEVSPDGRKLAFPAAGADGKPHLWIRSFDSLDARLLPGTELANVPAPFLWSYDSRFIAFLSSDRKLKKVDISGGPAQTLCDAAGVWGGSWSPDGTILYGGFQGAVMRVSAAGGTPTALTGLDRARAERGHLSPKLLPDGRHFLYFRQSTTPGASGIYVGSIDAKPSEQSTKPLLVNEGFPEYYVPSPDSDTGYLLFYREGTVLAQPFNPNKLELSGDPVPIAEPVGSASGSGFFSASANGVLTYVEGNGGAGNTQLTWFNREGKTLGTVGDSGIFSTSALSPDGKLAAVSRLDAQYRSSDLWLLDLMRAGAATRFTFDASIVGDPVFSPDGSRIVFLSNRDGPGNLYQKLTNGAKNEEPLLKSTEAKFPTSWSGDGRFLLYAVRTAKAKGAIWILPMEGSKKEPMPFQVTEFSETFARFSPDGRWIAYDSDESGRGEVYVREFLLGSDGKPEATGKHQISTGGGTIPQWREDGKELFYMSLDRASMMSAEITTQPGFQSLPGKMLFQLPVALGAPPAVSGDGKRFLVATPVAQSGPQQFTVVQNWQAGLKK
jgi:Tol biopolymer transport system component/predicted Ser/Thr protein kinase